MGQCTKRGAQSPLLACSMRSVADPRSDSWNCKVLGRGRVSEVAALSENVRHKILVFCGEPPRKTMRTTKSLNEGGSVKSPRRLSSSATASTSASGWMPRKLLYRSTCLRN